MLIFLFQTWRKHAIIMGVEVDFCKEDRSCHQLRIGDH